MNNLLDLYLFVIVLFIIYFKMKKYTNLIEYIIF